MKKDKKIYSFPVVIEKDRDGWYIGTVPALRSCYTQAKSLPELYERLEEVVGLCLLVEKEDFHSKPPRQNDFLGVQKLEFSV